MIQVYYMINILFKGLTIDCILSMLMIHQKKPQPIFKFKNSNNIILVLLWSVFNM